MKQKSHKKTKFYIVGKNILLTQDPNEKILGWDYKLRKNIVKAMIPFFKDLDEYSAAYKSEITLQERKNSWESAERKIFFDKNSAQKYAAKITKNSILGNPVYSPIIATVVAYPKLEKNNSLKLIDAVVIQTEINRIPEYKEEHKCRFYTTSIYNYFKKYSETVHNIEKASSLSKNFLNRYNNNRKNINFQGLLDPKKTSKISKLPKEIIHKISEFYDKELSEEIAKAYYPKKNQKRNLAFTDLK